MAPLGVLPLSTKAIFLVNISTEDADALDFYLHHIATLHGTHPGGSAGGYDVPRLQGHGGGDELHDLGNAGDEKAGIAFLYHPAIEPGLNIRIGGVDLVCNQRTDGSKAVHALAPGPLAVGLLPAF